MRIGSTISRFSLLPGRLRFPSQWSFLQMVRGFLAGISPDTKCDAGNGTNFTLGRVTCQQRGLKHVPHFIFLEPLDSPTRLR